MLCKEYISNELPVVHYEELGHNYLQQDVQDKSGYLVVEDADNKFLGLIENKFLCENADTGIFTEQLSRIAVNGSQHILYALQLMQSSGAEFIAVVDEANEYLGELSRSNVITAMWDYLSVNDTLGGIIVLEINAVHYSIAEIVQIVHSANADIVQYNTQHHAQTGNITVSIVLNKRDISLIVATFQRYEYHIKYYFGEELYDNELKSNYDLLMKYISI